MHDLVSWNGLPWVLATLGVFALLLGLFFLWLPSYFHPANIPDDKVEVEKAKRDIEDLRHGWMRTLGTALVTASIAVGGWVIQQVLARQDLEYRAQLNLNDTYGRYIGDLGDPSKKRRLAATAYLSDGYSVAEAGRRRQIVDALVYQYSEEDDDSIRTYIGRQLQDDAMLAARPDVLKALIRENRNVLREYAQAAGKFIGEGGLQEKGAKRSLDPPARPLETDDVRLNDAINAYNDTAGFRIVALRQKPNSITGKTERLADLFESAYRSAYNSPVPDPKTLDSDRRAARRAHKRLDATGVLIAIFLNEGVTPKHNDFEGVFIPRDAQISLRKLAAPNLQYSTIFGEFAGVQWDAPDFRNADLCHAMVAYASRATSTLSFRRARTSGACLPVNVLSSADLSGSDLSQAWAVLNGHRQNAAQAYREARTP